MKSVRRSKFLALFGLALILLGIGLAHAPRASAAEVKGLVVSPAIQEVTLDADKPEVTFPFTVTNTSDGTLDLDLSSLDFGALNESGGVAFLGRGGQETTSYGLKQWLGLEKETLTLGPGESQTVQATVTNKQSLNPGGHYGAIVVTAGQEAGKGNQSVSVLPSASVLVLLKKTGGDTYKLNLLSATPQRSVISLPKEVDLRFRNDGNTHVVPRGMVTLKDPFGHEIARQVINEDSSFVLPEAYRVFKVQFASAPHGWMPGRYTVTTTWRYDGTTKTSTSVTHIWYIGLVPLIGLGIIVFVNCAYFVRKRFSRKAASLT